MSLTAIVANVKLLTVTTFENTIDFNGKFLVVLCACKFNPFTILYVQLKKWKM